MSIRLSPLQKFILGFLILTLVVGIFGLTPPPTVSAVPVPASVTGRVTMDPIDACGSDGVLLVKTRHVKRGDYKKDKVIVKNVGDCTIKVKAKPSKKGKVIFKKRLRPGEKARFYTRTNLLDVWAKWKGQYVALIRWIDLYDEPPMRA